MAKYIAQLIITGSQIVGRAFARAIKQEIEASQEAARRLGHKKGGAEEHATNTKLGLSLEEAKMILDIKDLTKEEIEKKYEALFNANEKEKGGSFYLQSKVVRAKERLEHELLECDKVNDKKSESTRSSSNS